MSNQSKLDYLSAIRNRYHAAGRREKTSILDEFCSVCGYNRKYATRLVNQKTLTKKSGPVSKAW